MKILNYLILFIILSVPVTAQSYYKQCEYNNEESRELTLRVGLRNDTTILLNLIRGEVPVLYNYYLDDFGNTLDVILRDTLLMDSPRVIRSSEFDITIMPTLTYGQSLSIKMVTLEGSITLEKSIVLFESNILSFEVLSSTISAGNIVISGGLNDEEGRKAFMVWLDSDLNLLQVHITDNSFASIGGIAADENGNVYGITAFVDYEMTNCGSCVNTARYYFSSFDKSSFIDTLDLILDGLSTTNKKTLSFTFLEGQDFLIGITTEALLTMIFLRYNASSGIMWELDSLNILHGPIRGDGHYVTSEGKIIHLLATDVGDDIGPKQTGVIISYISPDGEVIWSKKYFRYYDSGLNKLDLLNNAVVEDEDNLLFQGLYVKSISHQKPLLLKIDRDGCLTEDCHLVQVAGYYPPPNTGVSHRNIWFVYNKETNERCRYSFIDQRLPLIGGRLLRSDDMAGDIWYFTNRKFVSGFTAFNEISYPDIPGSSSIIPFYYKYDLELGDELKLWNTVTSEHTHHILKVIEKEEIEFLDGRKKNKLTLECYNPDVEIEPLQVTWIDYLGDPNDLFNTLNACSEPGNEVVTCFYSDGELMWSHPDFEDCNPTGIEEFSELSTPYSIHPNPTKRNITIPQEIGSFIIVSQDGKEVYRSENKIIDRQIDVSNLESGLYYLFEQNLNEGSHIIKFIKY